MCSRSNMVTHENILAIILEIITGGAFRVTLGRHGGGGLGRIGRIGVDGDPGILWS